MAPRNWALVTGEYPPQRGGVADYCLLLARAMVAAGDHVEIWMPPCSGSRPVEAGVICHELSGAFDGAAVKQLEVELRRLPSDTTVVVQYVPQAFGLRGMNLNFCLAMRRLRPRTVWTMFHEVAMPFTWRQSVRYQILAVVQRLMAAVLLRASTQVFVAIPAWTEVLRPLGTSSPQWLPVPSNLPLTAKPPQPPLKPAAISVGHFGTYGASIASDLLAVLPHVLSAKADVEVLLMGYGADLFAATLRRAAPTAAARIRSVTSTAPLDVSAALHSCDVLFQPYPDGASCRRGSLMAGLSLGKAVISTAGVLSEPIWASTGAIRQVAARDHRAMIDAVLALLGDETARGELGTKAKALYFDHFAWDRLITKLRAA